MPRFKPAARRYPKHKTMRQVGVTSVTLGRISPAGAVLVIGVPIIGSLLWLTLWSLWSTLTS